MAYLFLRLGRVAGKEVFADKVAVRGEGGAGALVHVEYHAVGIAYRYGAVHGLRPFVEVDVVHIQMSNIFLAAPASGHKQCEAQHKQCEVEQLGADIAFAQNNHAVDERYYHAAATQHGHHRNHGSRQRQRVEIAEVGGCEEYRDTNDGPPPGEAAAAVPRAPQHSYRRAHQD